MKTGTRAAVLLALLVAFARAHGDHAEVDENPNHTYAELHMAQEVSSILDWAVGRMYS